MYCVRCGVRLADTEKVCPLCATPVFHPEITRQEAESLYPRGADPVQQITSRQALVILSALFLLPVFIVLLCDLQLNGRVVWCGYVIGALILTYQILVLPNWFRRPNPVIFVPCGFVTIGLYLLYINLATGGSWFLSFALPVTAGIGIIVTAVVTLLRYTRSGRLYIFGGASILMGLLMLLTEFLLNLTFSLTRFVGWSLYPLVIFALLGITFIVLAIFRPARQMMERKFFL